MARRLRWLGARDAGLWPIRDLMRLESVSKRRVSRTRRAKRRRAAGQRGPSSSGVRTASKRSVSRTRRAIASRARAGAGILGPREGACKGSGDEVPGQKKEGRRSPPFFSCGYGLAYRFLPPFFFPPLAAFFAIVFVPPFTRGMAWAQPSPGIRAVWHPIRLSVPALRGRRAIQPALPGISQKKRREPRSHPSVSISPQSSAAYRLPRAPHRRYPTDRLSLSCARKM